MRYPVAAVVSRSQPVQRPKPSPECSSLPYKTLWRSAILSAALALSDRTDAVFHGTMNFS